MAVRMTKDWRPLSAVEADKVAGNLGVYQLANDAGEILYIGVAGGRSLFGLPPLQPAEDGRGLGKLSPG
jgi:hypothetical protein